MINASGRNGDLERWTSPPGRHRASVIAECLVELHAREEVDHRLLGRTRESAGRLEGALKACARAFELAVEDASPHLDLFRASLEAIRKKIQVRDE